MPEPQEPRTFTVAEVAPLLGMTPRAIYHHVEAGTFPGKVIRLGSRILITRSSLEAAGILPPAAAGS